MKPPIFHLSTVLILPAALLLHRPPARAAGPEEIVSLPIADQSPVPPSPLVEWFGLSETTAEEPAAICTLQPPPDPGDDATLVAKELPPLVVGRPPLPALPATDWPDNVIDALEPSRGLGLDPTPTPSLPMGESGEGSPASPDLEVGLPACRLDPTAAPEQFPRSRATVACNKESAESLRSADCAENNGTPAFSTVPSAFVAWIIPYSVPGPPQYALASFACQHGGGWVKLSIDNASR